MTETACSKFSKGDKKCAKMSLHTHLYLPYNKHNRSTINQTKSLHLNVQQVHQREKRTNKKKQKTHTLALIYVQSVSCFFCFKKLNVIKHTQKTYPQLAKKGRDTAPVVNRNLLPENKEVAASLTQ